MKTKDENAVYFYHPEVEGCHQLLTTKILGITERLPTSQRCSHDDWFWILPNYQLVQKPIVVCRYVSGFHKPECTLMDKKSFSTKIFHYESLLDVAKIT